MFRAINIRQFLMVTTPHVSMPDVNLQRQFGYISYLQFELAILFYGICFLVSQLPVLIYSHLIIALKSFCLSPDLNKSG